MQSRRPGSSRTPAAAKPPKYSFGGLPFNTKTGVLNHAKSLKPKYANEVVTDQQDIAFLTDLVMRHYKVEEKIGSGIAGFAVMLNSVGNGYEFKVVQSDGSLVNFKPKTCLTKPHPLAHVHEACRQAIRQQIAAFKSAQFQADATLRCPFRGTPLTSANATVDHIAPDTFFALVRRWMETNKLTPETIKLDGTGPNDGAKSLADPAQLDSWLAFHQQNANLRIVSLIANLSDCKNADQS